VPLTEIHEPATDHADRLRSDTELKETKKSTEEWGQRNQAIQPLRPPIPLSPFLCRFGSPKSSSDVLINHIVTMTAAQVDSTNTLDSAVADPDMESPCQKVNEMILNGWR